MWCVRWAAAICRFIDKECSELPSELERALPQYYGAGTGVDSKGEAEAVKEARIMSLVVTLDKVRAFCLYMCITDRSATI